MPPATPSIFAIFDDLPPVKIDIQGAELMTLSSAPPLLHECYGSIDLALHFLLAHDQRSGGNVSPRYLKSVTGR